MSLFQPVLNSAIRRVEIDGKMYFSVLDVFAQYSGKTNPTQLWKATEKRLEKQGAIESIELRRHQFEGKGQRETPVATFTTFLRIAQSADFKDWEDIRQWMAVTGNERIEEMTNPELGISRAEQRYIAGKVAQGLSEDDARKALEQRGKAKSDYKLLTAAIQQVCVDRPNYGQIINEEYLGLFGEIAKDLEKILNTSSVRDALPPLQLSYIQTAEWGLKEVLKQRGQLTNQQIISAARKVCQPLGQHLQSLCDALGIDHITGNPLLKA